jgi:hypothetical protein
VSTSIKHQPGGHVVHPLRALAAAAAPLPPGEALIASLTAESLLFAVFAVAFTLTAPTREGRYPFFATGKFAYLVVLSITAVAVSAAVSLVDIWPHGLGGAVRAGGIMLAIVVQPFFALAIANQARVK